MPYVELHSEATPWLASNAVYIVPQGIPFRLALLGRDRYFNCFNVTRRRYCLLDYITFMFVLDVCSGVIRTTSTLTGHSRIVTEYKLTLICKMV